MSIQRISGLPANWSELTIQHPAEEAPISAQLSNGAAHVHHGIAFERAFHRSADRQSDAKIRLLDKSGKKFAKIHLNLEKLRQEIDLQGNIVCKHVTFHDDMGLGTVKMEFKMGYFPVDTQTSEQTMAPNEEDTVFDEVAVTTPVGPLGVSIANALTPPTVVRLVPLPDGSASPLEGKVHVRSELIKFNGIDTTLWTLDDFKNQLIATMNDVERTLVFSVPRLPADELAGMVAPAESDPAAAPEEVEEVAVAPESEEEEEEQPVPEQLAETSEPASDEPATAVPAAEGPAAEGPEAPTHAHDATDDWTSVDATQSLADEGVEANSDEVLVLHPEGHGGEGGKDLEGVPDPPTAAASDAPTATADDEEVEVENPSSEAIDAPEEAASTPELVTAPEPAGEEEEAQPQDVVDESEQGRRHEEELMPKAQDAPEILAPAEDLQADPQEGEPAAEISDLSPGEEPQPAPQEGEPAAETPDLPPGEEPQPAPQEGEPAAETPDLPPSEEPQPAPQEGEPAAETTGPAIQRPSPTLSVAITDYVIDATHQFVLYNIMCQGVDQEARCYRVLRRFKNFEELKLQLELELDGAVLPELPSKWSWAALFNRFDAALVESRRSELEKWLQTVCALISKADREANGTLHDFMTIVPEHNEVLHFHSKEKVQVVLKETGNVKLYGAGFDPKTPRMSPPTSYE